MPRKYTEARRDNNRKWDSENLDRLSVTLPKGTKDKVKDHAESMGESVNKFVGRAITETMERDVAGGTPGVYGGAVGSGVTSSKFSGEEKD